MAQDLDITEHVFDAPRHRTAYIAAGPQDGPLVVFCHGWPELGVSWVNQLRALAALGVRAVAPDMRGYGGSSVPSEPEAYCQREIVADMLELLDHLGREQAVWVGHDWGAPVVWNIASHHPDRCRAVGALSVPYYTVERGIAQLCELVDRDLYPADRYPAGQWEYMRLYEEAFEATTATWDANPRNSVKALLRSGDPTCIGRRSIGAVVREEGGFFGGAPEAPDVPLDTNLLSEAELEPYVTALARNGFRGPDSWYMNDAANAAYAEEALNDGRLDMPVLFLGGAYEDTAETQTSRLAVPMAERCSDLTAVAIPAGHWMSMEHPAAVNAALVRWLATRVGLLEPDPDGPSVRLS
ncbi:MAG TPA: alpha/beta hydrolase [Conexibacter sp.]|nr:alpha/beta hydrolase [Conexibacter sp.]